MVNVVLCLPIHVYMYMHIDHCPAAIATINSKTLGTVLMVTKKFHIFFREVVMSMLLRLVEHSRVVYLLTHVLDCYKKKKSKWLQVSPLLTN